MDDLILLADSSHRLEFIKKQLSPNFKGREYWRSRHFLDMAVDWTSPGCVRMKHRNILQKLLSKTGMLNSKPVGSLVDLSVTHDEAMKSEPLSPKVHSIYRSITGSLLYLALKTRTNLCVVASMVG